VYVNTKVQAMGAPQNAIGLATPGA